MEEEEMSESDEEDYDDSDDSEEVEEEPEPEEDVEEESEEPEEEVEEEPEPEEEMIEPSYPKPSLNEEEKDKKIISDRDLAEIYDRVTIELNKGIREEFAESILLEKRYKRPKKIITPEGQEPTAIELPSLSKEEIDEINKIILKKSYEFKDAFRKRKNYRGEIINLPPNILQLCTRRLGLYCSTYLGNDLYYLNGVVKMVISYLGRDWMTQEYPNYEKIEKILKVLDSRLMEVKVWYDSIEDKKFDKKNAEVNIKKFYLKKASKVAMYENVLVDVFVFLVARTNLQRQVIPAEAFKVLEHTGYRKIELDKKKQTTTESKPESNPVS